jgi:hypothetical protein
MDYKEALERVSLYIHKRERVKPLDNYNKRKVGLPDILDIWEIETEILDKLDIVKNIRFHLVFLPDFPLSFPKIFLAEKDFNDIKYIPHLQVDKLICVFQNNSEPNVLRPEEVVEEALKRAKTVIEDGLNKKNEKDYSDEFEAYWNSNYSKKDIVNKSFLLLNEEPLKESFTLLLLEKSVNQFHYIIHQNEGIAINFKSFLKDQRIRYNETTGYVIKELDFFEKPPYDKTNKEVFDAIKELNSAYYQEYISLINDKDSPKLFLFSKEINSEIRYFGWFHSKAKLNINGFRAGSLNNYKALSTFQSNERINRITPEVYTNRRLIKRSAGNINVNKFKKFVLAGVGSIGSNLIHYLNSSLNPEFKLIDTDSLELENIARHYLGFKYLNWKKTIALKDFLTQFSPIQKVETREKSIIQIVQEEPEFINESDFLFIAIGESNIESWVADAVDKGLIIKPTFFVWVEPYLLGGHCIFINPQNNNYKKYFKKDGLFKFNVIGDYKNEVLSLKEAGCQSNYTPYSSNNIQLFLGFLNLEISKIIESNNPESKSFTWIGDKRIAKKMNIELSRYSAVSEANTLIENKL